jgi:phage gp37-like protein
MDLTAIEQAIIAAIKGLNRPYLKDVASYGGEFDDDLFQVVRRFPAAWVTFAGAGVPKRFGMGSGKWMTPLTFVVMVGARSVRNEASTRQGVVSSVDGSQIEPGSYQMLADVQAALMGQDLGLPIDPFAPGKISTLFNAKVRDLGMSVLAQEWRTRLLLKRAEPDAPWLQQVMMDFLVQPSDETPDVEVDVMLGGSDLEGDEGAFGDGSRLGDGGGQAG